MNIRESIGFVFVGAVATFGISAFWGEEAVTDVVETEVQVSRASTDLNTFAILENVLGPAQNEDAALGVVAPVLTEEQEQISELLRATARRQNEAKGPSDSGNLQLSNMAVVGLNVRYYYTVSLGYDDVEPGALLADQVAVVVQTACGSSEIKMLMEDYGFDFSYAYTSNDGRLMGKLNVNLASCDG
jgi:hypothetical protein